MKNAAIGLVLVSGLMLAIGLGMAYGLTDKYAAAGALAACPIWVPGLVFLVSVPLAWYIVHQEKRASAQKFKTWCSPGINTAEDDKQVIIYLEAIIVALDACIINREDVSDIFQKCASSEDDFKKLRLKLAELIQDRLERGTWNLKEADDNRRRLIENFAYYRA